VAFLQQLLDAAKNRGIELHILKAGTGAEVDAAFGSIDGPSVGAVIVGLEAFFTTQRNQIVALAASHAIPAIYPEALFPRAGGLISYGPSLPAAYRLKGNYTGRILNGAKPADLPVQQPTTLELVINLATAKALGLDVPPSLLARADEVIE
jgi:putative tryptophan/tyrosine transport system substrate-binding protein